MSSDVINFNKPCSACRRRKVRCDKAQPCNNCIRHRVACVYEAPRESVMSQQLLQDRVDRLERMVEDLAAYSLTNPGSQYRRSSSSATSPFSSLDDYNEISADAGHQVFSCGNSYYMGPDSWMNVDQLSPAQQHLLNVCPQGAGEEQLAWSMSQTRPRPKDLAHLHLTAPKEDAMLVLFFENVEPLIRINHQPYFWQLVSDFRQGTCLASREVEALMFSAQYITASVLPAAVIEEKLGLAKLELVIHLQQATQLAFDQANIMRTRSVLLFSALLYYITCQFHTGNCEAGSTLLGLATSIARRIGMHRDPAYYGYAPWCVEIRRRMWGHLATLDAQACSTDGSESLLASMGDVQRSFNLNDADFKLARYVPGDSGPRDRDGFSEATVALIRREICRTTHAISEARRTAIHCIDLMGIVDEASKYVRLKFIHHFDGSDPMQHMIAQWSAAMIKSLAISVLYLHASPSRPKLQCHMFDQVEEQLYDDCLACLEDFSQGEEAAAPFNWQWAFRWPMPFHVIAGLLSGLARIPDHRDTDRAWEQVDIAFQRYNNDEISMAKVPAWHTIEVLCDQAMLLHQNEKHDGRAYTKRVHAAQPATGAESVEHSQMHHKAAGMPGAAAAAAAGIYGIDTYDGLRKQTLAEVASGDAMSMGFDDSEIDAVFFNVNADDDFLVC